MNNKEPNKNQSEENLYVPIKLLGEGSYGRAYLVKSSVDEVQFFS